MSEGIYYEEVVVRTPSLTIRGVDRNTVIVDGEFERANGFLVAGVDGVAIENITVNISGGKPIANWYSSIYELYSSC